jgi:hypothetical protein
VRAFQVSGRGDDGWRFGSAQNFCRISQKRVTPAVVAGISNRVSALETSLRLNNLKVAITQEQRKQLHDALVALPPALDQRNLDSDSAEIITAMLEITDEEARKVLEQLVSSEVIKAELCPRGGEHYAGDASTKWVSGAHT